MNAQFIPCVIYLKKSTRNKKMNCELVCAVLHIYSEKKTSWKGKKACLYKGRYLVCCISDTVVFLCFQEKDFVYEFESFKILEAYGKASFTPDHQKHHYSLDWTTFVVAVELLKPSSLLPMLVEEWVRCFGVACVQLPVPSVSPPSHPCCSCHSHHHFLLVLSKTHCYILSLSLLNMQITPFINLNTLVKAAPGQWAVAAWLQLIPSSN